MLKMEKRKKEPKPLGLGDLVIEMIETKGEMKHLRSMIGAYSSFAELYHNDKIKTKQELRQDLRDYKKKYNNLTKQLNKVGKSLF